ncbi:endonuclease NucS [Blastopirellula sp. J2-11]|uniref:DUF5655 domain-containing protein n=1 Tax=Blastopirellula sp. J2-11 TaxID=2943192 RepID=UPI0021CA1135|nr:DUF5655 domain-containing protein [Blastopirellula sp. J2-11]UUO09027.1 endonuclease NucS [Blastopirellula sp. J2-11]
MSDIKLFRTNGETVTQLEGQSVALEKSLQKLIERHLDIFLGIRFLATEYSTGKTHGGRIDTLGIDENGCPCIIEYKRSSNENVINQGLYYLDWLLDHRGEFELLVLKTLGAEAAENIEWSSPRLLCIAGGFTKYDGHAVSQINRNIELLRYLRFGDELLLLELVNAVQAKSLVEVGTTAPIEILVEANTTEEVESAIRARNKARQKDKSVSEQMLSASPELLDLFGSLEAMCMSFGDDVQMKMLKLYVAFKRLKNFATAEVRAGTNCLAVFVKLDPDMIALEEGFTRDVRNIGHWGTGDLEIMIRSQNDLEKALPLLQASYEGS